MTARLMVVRLFCLLRSTWSEEIEIVCCHNKRLREKKIRKKIYDRTGGKQKSSTGHTVGEGEGGWEVGFLSDSPPLVSGPSELMT